MSLTSERDSLVEEVAVAGKKSKELQQVLTELTQSSQLEVERLSQQVENKSRAGESPFNFDQLKYTIEKLKLYILYVPRLTVSISY